MQNPRNRSLRPRLNVDQRVPLLCVINVTKQMQLEHAQTWALRRFANEEALSFYVVGAALVVRYGMLTRIGLRRDGEWVVARKPLTRTVEETATIERHMSYYTFVKVLDVVVGCKANWWITNHYSDRETPNHYVRDILLEHFGSRIELRSMLKASHIVGRWVSTLHVLEKAGLPGLRPTRSAVVGNPMDWTISESVKIKMFNCPPAGTERLGIAYLAAQKLVRHVLVRCCPDAGDFAEIAQRVGTILSNSPSYHICAPYLTGNERSDYHDQDAERFLGRLGIFILMMYPYTKIAMSPLLKLPLVQSYSDYSLVWNDILTSFRISVRTVSGAARFQEENAKISKETVEQLKQAFEIPS